MTDVLIAGGGLAGSAAAILLGRLGLSVELFERGEFPKEKPCGEGLMPAGVAALARLRLGQALDGAPFFGIRYHFEGRAVGACFPPQGPPPLGRGYRRRDLDHALFASATSTPGVTAHTGTRVEAPQIEHGRVTGLIVEGEPRRGQLVIVADGAHSRLRYALGLDAPDRRKRVGMRAHFRLARGRAPSEWVDIYLGRGFELYVTPLWRRELLVAALAPADALSGPIEKQFQRWCNNQPGLSVRLQGAEQISELLVTSPLSGRALQRVLPGCVLLGDAAGFTDPVTGGGMTQALLAAELLAEFATEGGLGRADLWLAEFDREREALLRDYRTLTAAVLWLAERPALVGTALETAARWPQVFSHLLGVSGGMRRLWGGEVRLKTRPRCVTAWGRKFANGGKT